ncbi:CLUMA_CG010956, isoform A [Clunio marinus]|uniref:CLUMA_CG010956, isoform A n=1 Tax=Clunio marinus TaxID=568069 RepID=A0A1J1ICU2_9DIPT|nr:CLUMA_CG010956, isoform A [Clunio marinus]
MRTNRPTTAAEEMGLGPKKTFLVLFTVVGCIAILFPKIFYPMLMGAGGAKDHSRGPPNLLKQERPPYLSEIVIPGMQERGRAIPPHSVSIIERPGRPGGLPSRPGMIERRPGSPMVQGQPGPNMRAAAYQAQTQSQPKAQGPTSIIMPIYTFGIVAFFIFTISKLVMKKLNKNQSQPIESDPVFVEKVFRQTQPDAKKKLGWKDHNAIYTAIQGIIDATNDQLREIEKECAENNSEHFDNNSERSNAHKSEHEETDEDTLKESSVMSDDLSKLDHDENEKEKSKEPSEHDIEIEKRLSHLKEAMHIKSVENDENSDFKSIFLEGELPHDPQILVSATETETKTEKISNYAKELADDEAVILSGKMTISLISLTNNDEEKNGVLDEEQHTTTNNVA